tara:strand:+ start:183 stop:407 length:225 start_codon:yes stop_codon:yes gene_type:complete
MKLSDVKNKIDSYFENIDAHELYEISISKYGFIDGSLYTVNIEYGDCQAVDKVFLAEELVVFNEIQDNSLFLAA